MAADYRRTRVTMLAALLPSGTDRWVALFDGDPNDGGTELVVGGYARVAHSSWVTTNDVGASTRANIGTVTFGPVSDAAPVAYWGIYDEATLGNLLQSNVLHDGANPAVAIPPIALVATDVVEFADGTLRITVVDG